MKTLLFMSLLIFSFNAFAGRRNPLNSVPHEVSNLDLCADTESSDASKAKREDFCWLTNSIREWHLSSSLMLDSDLSKIAQNVAENTTEDPDSILESKMESEDYDYEISKDKFIEPHEMISDLLASTKEKKKFLKNSFRKIGVGYHDGTWAVIFTN